MMTNDVLISYPPQWNKKILDYKNLIHTKGYKNVFIQNDIIEFENRQINMEHYDILQKREPNGAYTIALKRQILLVKIEKIENADIILIMNEPFNDTLYFELSIAYYLKKNIFLYGKINRQNDYFDTVSAMRLKTLNRDINNFPKPLIRIMEDSMNEEKRPIKDAIENKQSPTIRKQLKRK